METEQSPRTLTIAIAPRTIALVVAVGAVLWLGSRLGQVLVLVFGAILLATAVDEPASWLQRRRVPRSLAILSIFATLLLILALLVATLVPLLGAEARGLRDQIPAYGVRLERALGRVAPDAGADQRLSFANLAADLAGHLDAVVGSATTVTLTAGRTAVLALAMVVVAYFLAVDPQLGTRLLVRFAPAPIQARVSEGAESARRRIGAWARGQIAIALSFGAAMGLGLWALGVPYALSLGFTAAVLELVPYVGGAATVVLAALMAATLGLPQVVAVLVLYVVLVNVEAHVLSPVLLGHAVGLPSVAVLLALLVGVELLGVAGALLAVPATVVAWAAIEEVWPASEARRGDASALRGEGRHVVTARRRGA